MINHEWGSIETEKDILKAGDVYCVECKKRSAKVMCTSCWDPYCNECFRYVHHIGALKEHKPMNYRKAKQGWLCIKARLETERDYYVNGSTGEVTYDKPEELMTEQEKIYFENFRIHKLAALDHVKTIDKLQFDLEAASYERDTILFDAINGTGKIGQLLKNRNKKNKGDKRGGGSAGGGGGGNQSKGAISKVMDFFKGTNKKENIEYREKILSVNPRERKQARDEYIQGLIQNALGKGDDDS